MFFTCLFSEDAAAILDTAENVLKALKGSEEAQNKAKTAIEMADQDIEDARLDLTQVKYSSLLACSWKIKVWEFLLYPGFGIVIILENSCAPP